MLGEVEMCVEAMERREKRGKETSGRDEERVESTRKKRTKKNPSKAGTTHNTQKNEDFLLEK